MNYFIKNIHVNKLFHLNNFDIPIADEKYPKCRQTQELVRNERINEVPTYRERANDSIIS